MASKRKLRDPAGRVLVRVDGHYFWVGQDQIQAMLAKASEGEEVYINEYATAVFEQDVLDFDRMTKEDARREYYERGGSN